MRGIVRHFWVVLIVLGLNWPQLLLAEEKIAVIVGKSIGHHAVQKEDIARIYLRKKLFWEDGTVIVPVNLPVGNTIRQRFSSEVLGALPEDLEDYWNAQYFHGIMPPYVLASEAAVIQFVATTPGTIGYVTAPSITDQVQVLFYLPTSTVSKSQ